MWQIFPTVTLPCHEQSSFLSVLKRLHEPYQKLMEILSNLLLCFSVSLPITETYIDRLVNEDYIGVGEGQPRPV